MSISYSMVESLRITDAGLLDPITVVFIDYETGKGKVIIECFGQAWACYFGGMGDRKIRQFVAESEDEYLTNKLADTARRWLKRDQGYLYRIIHEVRTALNAAP